MIVLFLAFSIPPDWVYLNAKTVQDRHTQRGIEMDNKVLDEAVEVARLAYEVEVDGQVYSPNVPADAMRAALLASLPVLLGEPVATVQGYRVGGSAILTWHGKPAAMGTKLYAPSLGEGDGR